MCYLNGQPLPNELDIISQMRILGVRDVRQLTTHPVRGRAGIRNLGTSKVPRILCPGRHHDSEHVSGLDDSITIISVNLSSLVLFPSEYLETFDQRA